MSFPVLFPIFLVVLVDLLAMMMIVPLLPFYAQKFGASATEIGLLASSYAVCQLFASPLLGALSDRVGRKRVLLITQIAALIGFVVMGLAHSLKLLFVSRIIDGIAAGNLPLAQAAVVDLTPPDKRAKAFGIIGVAFGIGLVLGPAISGWLAAYNWSYPIYAGAFLACISIVSTWVLFPKGGVNPTHEVKTAISDGGKGLRTLLVQFFIFVLAFAYFAQGLPLVVQARFNFGPTEVGFLFAYCGVLGIVVQGILIGHLVKRWGEARLVVFGFILDVVGYFLLGYVTEIEGIIFASTLFSVGNSFLRPSLTSLISQSVPEHSQGKVLGLTGSLQSAAHIFAPPLGGLLIDAQRFLLWSIALASISGAGFFMNRGQIYGRK